MHRGSLKIDTQSVFLNFPFDKSYEPVFLGIVVALITLGLKPRSVIEIPDRGEGRMERLFELIRSCGASIHDLSRVNTPVRFNMPFELGLAYALYQITNRKHFYIVMEKESNRLVKTLSDLRLIDPKIHHGKGQQAMRCIYESFKPEGQPPPIEMGQLIYKVLSKKLDAIRGKQKNIFNPLSFEEIITNAVGINELFK